MRTQLTIPHDPNTKDIHDCHCVAHMDQREYRMFLALQDSKNKITEAKKKFWRFW